MFHPNPGCFQSKGRVLVIGAGVIGLTTTLQLVKHGYRVTVLSKEFVAPDNQSKLTTQVAAAMWNIAVHGTSWKDELVEQKIRTWCWKGYDIFCQLATNAEQTGVFIRPRVNVYKHKINDNPTTRAYMQDHQHLPGFRHSDQIIKEKGLSSTRGLKDAMVYLAPVIDTDIFLMYLTTQCMSAGVDFIRETLRGTLRGQCDSLRKKHKADYIVNCSGIGARELSNDLDVYPKLGVGLILRNADCHFKTPDFVLAYQDGNVWFDEETKTTGSIVIVPRSSHSLWVGTFSQESYDTDLDIHHPIVRRMLKECQAMYPPLATISDEHFQVNAGLRPMRKGSPRVEQDDICPYLIHNYGHAACGVQVSWGCAEDVRQILEQCSPKAKI